MTSRRISPDAGMPTGRVPERRCIGCGRHAPKPALARFVAMRVDGGRRLVRDDGGRIPGRGLYVCPSRACFALAVKRRSFARAARMRGETLAIDDALVDALD